MLGIAFLALTQIARVIFAIVPDVTRDVEIEWDLAAPTVAAISVGMACALVAQRRPAPGVAAVGATLGWLAAAIAMATIAVFGPNLVHTLALSPEFVYTGTPIIVALSIAGFVPALLGALFGWGLAALAG